MPLGNLEIFGFPTSEVGKPGGYYSTQPYNEDGSIPWPRSPRPQWQSPDWLPPMPTQFPVSSSQSLDKPAGSQAALVPYGQPGAASQGQPETGTILILLAIIAMVALK